MDKVKDIQGSGGIPLGRCKDVWSRAKFTMVDGREGRDGRRIPRRQPHLGLIGLIVGWTQLDKKLFFVL